MKLQKKKGETGENKKKKKYKNTKGNRTKIHKNSGWTSDEGHVGRIGTPQPHPYDLETKN